jgi:hypothetical protein
VYAWYPGEQGGAAIASTLYGISNPSGRLPVTIPAVTNVLPHPLNQRMAQPPGMTSRLFLCSRPPRVGQQEPSVLVLILIFFLFLCPRRYSQQEPAFQFGFGLSYTRFAYLPADDGFLSAGSLSAGKMCVCLCVCVSVCLCVSVCVCVCVSKRIYI